MISTEVGSDVPLRGRYTSRWGLRCSVKRAVFSSLEIEKVLARPMENVSFFESPSDVLWISNLHVILFMFPSSPASSNQSLGSRPQPTGFNAPWSWRRCCVGCNSSQASSCIVRLHLSQKGERNEPYTGWMQNNWRLLRYVAIILKFDFKHNSPLQFGRQDMQMLTKGLNLSILKKTSFLGKPFLVGATFGRSGIQCGIIATSTSASRPARRWVASEADLILPTFDQKRRRANLCTSVHERWEMLIFCDKCFA